MANKNDRCRDCKKCTERGITRLTKKVANGALVATTLGGSAVGAAAVRGMRQNCPVCGHPITHHTVIDGRFKD